jgi:hypothetical protein
LRWLRWEWIGMNPPTPADARGSAPGNKTSKDMQWPVASSLYIYYLYLYIYLLFIFIYIYILYIYIGSWLHIRTLPISGFVHTMWLGSIFQTWNLIGGLSRWKWPGTVIHYLGCLKSHPNGDSIRGNNDVTSNQWMYRYAISIQTHMTCETTRSIERRRCFTPLHHSGVMIPSWALQSPHNSIPLTINPRDANGFKIL